VAAPSDDSTLKPSEVLLNRTGAGIVIDIGTGDGNFVYQSARRNPNKFYIGIDANPRPLEKISEKVHRKPAKGGSTNALFLQAAVEDLPSELDGVADEIHIHFPWGSLLQALLTGNESVLRNLRRVCRPDALLEILISIDPVQDRSELNRLQAPALSLAYIDSGLAPRFRTTAFEIVERGECPAEQWPELQSTWAKKLRHNIRRSLVYIIARATA
jgi:16S rRNA (adenine(1408)-N(1))-methyltransferase